MTSMPSGNPSDTSLSRNCSSMTDLPHLRIPVRTLMSSGFLRYSIIISRYLCLIT